MSLLLESIKIQNRALQNIEKHNARLNKARKELFGLTNFIDLREIIKIPTELTESIYKCRIIFNENIQSVEFLPYSPQKIKSLRLVNGDDIKYEYKYLNRAAIENLKINCGADDILITKKLRITDSSFANVALYDGKSWLTPTHPLLKGTKRQSLIELGKIKEEDIFLNDLRCFQKIVLINAMLEFDENEVIFIENVLPMQ